jgi:hypothetical protein
VYLRTSGPVVVNDAGADVDFRVEGDTDANLLFVDASADAVGIGENAPAYKLDIAQSNPTRGIVARVKNSAGSSQTGSQVNFLQDGIDNWAIGMPAGVSAFAFWQGRTSGVDGTELFRVANTGDVTMAYRRRGFIYAAGVSAGTTGTYNIDATGFPGEGSGSGGDCSRAYIYIIHSTAFSHFITGVALYSNNFNGNAALLATLGSTTVGGTITFGIDSAKPRATITNSSGATPTYFAEIVCVN